MPHVADLMMKKGWLESRKKMLCIHAIIITQVNFVLLLLVLVLLLSLLLSLFWGIHFVYLGQQHSSQHCLACFESS